MKTNKENNVKEEYDEIGKESTHHEQPPSNLLITVTNTNNEPSRNVNKENVKKTARVNKQANKRIEGDGRL